jgi:hypothetical protein
MKRTPPGDVISLPGLRIKRQGRSVEIDTHRTPAQQQRLLSAVSKSRDEMRTQIENATDQLAKLLHKYTSFDLVGHLWLRHGRFNMELYKETDSTVRPHFVEHAAMIQLKDPEYELTGEPLVDPRDIELAEQLLETIFQSTIALYATEAADPKRGVPPTLLDELRFKTLLREMMVGPPAYPHHWRTVLAGLFDTPHVSARLRETLGFDLRAALTCIETVGALLADVLEQRRAAAREQYERMKSQLARYTKTQKFDGKPEDKEMFDTLRNMRQKERNHSMKSLAAAWITVAVSDTLSFTAGTLSERAALPKETVSHFLDTFSLGFGSTPAAYILPSPSPAIRLRPIVKIGERYFCPIPSNLFWAIKATFEDALKQRSDWESYQKHRGKYLVDEGIAAIARMLPGSEVHQSLTYMGDKKRTELDGLVLFDRYVFLLEGKAGAFARAARRGAKGSMTRGLEDLIADPTQQAIRAWNYICTNDHPVFETNGGKQIAIDKARTTDNCLITLTLDSLDVFTPELHHLRAGGVLSGDDLPWAVCLTDLFAISELISSPSEFTHFVRWRLAVHAAGNISAGPDELNWLAIYMNEGPELMRTPVGFDRLMYTSYTDDFDAFFHYQGGYRTTRAERPSQPMPELLRILLAALERARLEGFTKATEFLLDLSFSERTEFAERLRRFASPKEKATEAMTFETSNKAVVLLRGRQSKDVLSSRVARFSSAQKKTLALALDASPEWEVFGWAFRVD